MFKTDIFLEFLKLFREIHSLIQVIRSYSIILISKLMKLKKTIPKKAFKIKYL
jgi:hypothetical protein